MWSLILPAALLPAAIAEIKKFYSQSSGTIPLSVTVPKPKFLLKSPFKQRYQKDSAIALVLFLLLEKASVQKRY